jgi:hypothetical protein
MDIQTCEVVAKLTIQLCILIDFEMMNNSHENHFSESEIEMWRSVES